MIGPIILEIHLTTVNINVILLSENPYGNRKMFLAYCISFPYPANESLQFQGVSLAKILMISLPLFRMSRTFFKYLSFCDGKLICFVLVPSLWFSISLWYQCTICRFTIGILNLQSVPLSESYNLLNNPLIYESIRIPPKITSLLTASPYKNYFQVRKRVVS